MVHAGIQDRLKRRTFLVLIPDKNFKSGTPGIIQLGDRVYAIERERPIGIFHGA
jgi:hypothetical protein